MVLDLGVGIFASIFVSWQFGLPFDWRLLMWGMGFSLLPDLDYFIHLARRGKLDQYTFKHREIFHWPIPYLALGAVVLWPWGMPWVALFWICSLAHFIHDSVGIGYGVQWFQPFSKHRFEFFYSFRPPQAPKAPIRPVHVWKHEEMDRLVQTVGDPDYLGNVYFKLHPYAIAEFSVFYLGLAALYLYLT
jgi:hypothetical protein